MYKVNNPIFKERIEQYLKRQMFMIHNGISLGSIEPGQVTAFLPIEEKHEQQFGRVHGGVISTIADIACGFAAYTLVPDDSHVVTGEIKISYFAPSRSGSLKAVGKVLKQGRKVSFCEADIFNIDNGSEKLVAKASSSMIIIPLEQK